jgi:hypothetical protein
METIINNIGSRPIVINEQNDGLLSILNKIVDWLNLIVDYGSLLDIDFNYKNINMVSNEEFSFDMRLASLGSEYKNWSVVPKLLHEDGESWSWEKLVQVSNTGLISWYCDKLGLSNGAYIQLTENLDIQHLGAFYHRMKIILENVEKIFGFLNGGKIYNNVDIKIIDKVMHRPNFKELNPLAYELCEKIKYYQLNQEPLTNRYLNMEKATDMAQLALFSIIKQNK